MGITNADLQRYAQLKAQETKLKTEIDEMKDMFAAELEPGLTYETPDYSLQARIGYYRPVDALFRKKYSEAKYPQFYKSVVDEATVRSTLDDDKLDAVAKRIAPSFVIKAKTKVAK